ncbi:putative ribonuclease H-like domain-containing protein [Tanacetum coccineum]
MDDFSNKSEIDSENSLTVFVVRSSDEESTLANNRFTKTNEYHVVPPPIIGNPLTLRADISFAGLDEYAFRNKIIESKTNETNKTVGNTNEATIVKPKSVNETVVSKSKINRNEVIIEDWTSNDEDDVTDHLIKDCDFYKSPEPRVKNMVNTGERVVKPVWDYGKRGNPEILLQDHAVVDSGCSSHMTGNKAYLSDYEDFNGGFVAFGSDPKGGKITGKGKIKTANLDFDDVYFVDELKFNLFSVSQMCDKKNSVLFTESECLILSPSFKLLDESQVVLRAPRKDGVYSLDLKNIVPSGGITCLYANATADESKLWHRRLGHVNFKNINKLVKGHLVRGLPSKVFVNDHTCVACKKGKQHKASCKAKLDRIIRKPLELLHMDLFGPVSIESINKKRYCLVVTDDFSRFSWVFFLATKDETSEILCNLIIGLEKQLNHNVKIIRCDNRTEFKNLVMNEFCANKGIKREFSVARTPQQNGVAKKKNITLIEAVRTMLADSLLPIPFWAEAVNTACYVLNRVLVTKPQNKTPYELLIGKSPSISFMRPFGCSLTILNTLDSLGKFDGKSDEDQPNVAGTGPNWMFDLDFLTNSVNYIPISVENQVNVDAGTQDSYVASSSGKDKGPTLGYIWLPLQSHRTRIPIKDVAPDAHEKPSESSPNDNDIQDSKDVIDKEGQHQMPEDEQVLHDELKKMVTQELTAKAMDDVSRQAFEEEKRRIASQKKAAQATSTNKLSTDRQSVSTDRPSVSTDRPFVSTDRSSVSTANTPYVSAARTSTGANAGESSFVYLGGKIPIDASTLPNADLPIDPNMPDLEDASDTLPNDGIFNGAYDDDEDVGAVADFNNMDNTIAVSPIPTLRIHKDHPKAQILRDPILVVQTKGEIQKASSTQQALVLVDLPYGKKVIGTKWVFENKRDERSIAVKNKARLVAQGFRQEEGIDYGEVFATVARIEAIRLFLAFASYMGFTVYQMDVKHAFLYCTIEEEVYVHQPSGFDDLAHPNKVYKVIKALYGLHQAPRAWYETLSSFLMENGFRRDSDYRGASLDRKSTTSGCQFLGKRLISWQCKKQTIMANSTTKTEYVAAANCCGQVLWIQNQMMDCGFIFMNTKIHIDNESTISVIKNLVAHSRTKNIEIRFHFIRYCYEKRLIETRTDPSPRPSPSIAIPDSNPEGSGGNHGGQSSNDISLSGNEDGSGQEAKEMSQTTSHTSQILDEECCTEDKIGKKDFSEEKGGTKEVYDAMDYMESEDAQDEGRTRFVVLEENESADKEVSTEAPVSIVKPNEGTDKRNKGTDKQDGGTDSIKVSIDRQDEGTADQNEEKNKGKNATQIAPTTTSIPTPTIFGKKRIEEEDESDTESEDITEAEKKFKQLANDEEVARKVQEEWEAEEEKKRQDLMADKNLLKSFKEEDSDEVKYDETEEVEDVYLNVVIRSNRQRRYFSTLMAVLSILDRDDICAIYQLVMNRYQDETPEGFDKILWGDLIIMFNQSDSDEFWNAQQNWKILKLETEEDNTMALELIRFVKKQIAELEPKDSDGDEEDP